MTKSRLYALCGGAIISGTIFAATRGEIAFAVLMFLAGNAFACWAAREGKRDNA